MGKRTGKPRGRPKGVPNKITTELKEMILEAAHQAGGADGTVGYLKTQAGANPTAFMSLLGRVLPLQVGGDKDNPLTVRNIIEQHIVDPKS